jgi:rhamnosyltransferase
VSDPLATVLIRAKNEADGIGRTLELLKSQTLADSTEIVVVDSGSTDGTVDIVRDAGGVKLIEIPAEEFTYGRALNIGTEAARAPIVIPLSAHAFPRHQRFVERTLELFEEYDRAACVTGTEKSPTGEPIEAPFVQDLELALREPTWGYSNSAGGYRKELWQQRHFREDMPFTEDKEWALHWLREGWSVVLDPALMVDHDHAHDPLPVMFRRARDLWIGLGMYVDLTPYPLGALVREWWTDVAGYRNSMRARLSPWRVSALLGKYVGRRMATRS